MGAKNCSISRRNKKSEVGNIDVERDRLGAIEQNQLMVITGAVCFLNC